MEVCQILMEIGTRNDGRANKRGTSNKGFFSSLCLTLLIHSNLDLSAVNLGVYLDLVANSLLTEILLTKNSEFKRFELFEKPKYLDLVVKNLQKIWFF